MASPASPYVAASPLHLVGSFASPYTGAERRLAELARRVAGRRPVRLWSDVPPHASYARIGVQQISPFAQRTPRGGMVVIGGVHVRSDLWLRHAKAQRVAMLYNLPSHERLFAAIEAVRDAGVEPEIVFASRLFQQAVGLPGHVEPSWLNLAPFTAISLQRPPGRAVTVGRLSRDVPEKHGDADPALYRMLAARGMRVRVMGGTCLAAQLQGVEGVELLPEGAEDAARFLASLDIFFYRTGSFVEALGRVVCEAMAAGLPVVGDERGGYAELLRHGESGVVFETQEQAWDALVRLAGDPALRARMGGAARADVEALYGDAAGEALLQFYLH